MKINIKNEHLKNIFSTEKLEENSVIRNFRITAFDGNEFTYKDIDFLPSPIGWLEARLENRLREGFLIWRDEKEMSWRGTTIMN